jgi:hypothetical protein
MIHTTLRFQNILCSAYTVFIWHVVFLVHPSWTVVFTEIANICYFDTLEDPIRYKSNRIKQNLC